MQPPLGLEHRHTQRRQADHDEYPPICKSEVKTTISLYMPGDNLRPAQFGNDLLG